ncbi:hypothetical protein [Nitrosopumilus adriaticus]|uniref:hypothetical protein n=1 Tax=Nitrosopumilus adriaticus TaxID=1580092 RepID=UPI00352FCD3E
MKIYGIFLTVLLLSGSMSIVFAHPDTIGVSVQNQNGMILYENQLGISEKKTESIELFSTEWLYQNFIVMLSFIIITVMMAVSTITYKEDLQSLKMKHRIHSILLFNQK